jgi:sialic acid synthase SpsE
MSKSIDKNSELKSLEDQVAEFLKSGGEVTKVPEGKTGINENQKKRSIYITPPVDISRKKLE